MNPPLGIIEGYFGKRYSWPDRKADLALFQDVGLERLGARHADLRTRYAAIDEPAAQEVIAWLDGAYLMTDEQVRTQ
jgi:hypothetical protein